MAEPATDAEIDQVQIIVLAAHVDPRMIGRMNAVLTPELMERVIERFHRLNSRLAAAKTALTQIAGNARRTDVPPAAALVGIALNAEKAVAAAAGELRGAGR